MLVNRRFVEATGGVDLIGRILTPHGGGWRVGEVIGVVGDIREDALNANPVPYVYSCTAPGAWPDPEYVVAVTPSSRDMVKAIREIVRRLAPQRAVFGVSTLAEHLERTLDRPRLNAAVLGVFAASALISAALGLYGLVMLMVTARTREIGLKMALGATRARIVAQVAGEALRPLVVAIVIGATLAILVLQAFRSILFEIAPGDMLVFSCVCGLLVAVALAAALIPGSRAARIDPMQALRSE
jgi:putative ABC transport system permease protein